MMSLIPTNKPLVRWSRVRVQPALVLVLLFAGHAMTYPLAAGANNSGHRGGCDPKEGGLAEFPQNSLICLMAVVHGVALEIDGAEAVKLGPIGTQPDFNYLEIDVQETRGHQLVVYHGHHGRVFKRRRSDGATIRHEFLNARLFRRISQNIVQRGGNRHSWRSATVADLTLGEIQSLYLEGDLVQRVPTLEAYLSEARSLRYDGRLIIDVKELRSETAKTRLLDLVASYEATGGLRNPADDSAFDAQRTGLMVSSRAKRNRIFGSGCSSKAFRWWSDELRGRNIRLYRSGKQHPLILPKDCLPK